MASPVRPERSEAADYYFTYIDQVPPGDVVDTLWSQERETVELLETIGEERSLHRYAPDKWSIREVVAHLNDAERVFVFRAFWFARGFTGELPDFDQVVAVEAGKADARTMADHLDEFQAIRRATLTFFDGLPPEAWDRQGVASGNRFSVRALAYVAAGHVAHHLKAVRERYLP